MSTNQNTDGNSLTIKVTPPDAKVILSDPMYTSVTTSTNSPPERDHRLAINVRYGDVQLHFANLFMTLSSADWDRVVAGVEQARSAREAA